MAYQRSTVDSYNLKSVTFTPPDVALRGGPAVAFDEKALEPSGGPLHVAFWNHYVPVSTAIVRGLANLGFKETGQIQSGSLMGYAQFPATIDPTS
ncbi:hypothetical protein PT974_10333 [Cladobotryum mycophilum]|uniref:Uncharacterized protein n=1 Tax=Cladobotryum mycophilum TaxID=491253 RepID=A0ABR0S9K5_9HYPO